VAPVKSKSTLATLQLYLHEAAHVTPRKVVVEAVREDEQPCSQTYKVHGHVRHRTAAQWHHSCAQPQSTRQWAQGWILPAGDGSWHVKGFYGHNNKHARNTSKSNAGFLESCSVFSSAVFFSWQFGRAPVEPPQRKERHHQRWSSTASWKYVSAMVIKAVTITRMMNTMHRME
jgi:hypothetical protein